MRELSQTVSIVAVLLLGGALAAQAETLENKPKAHTVTLDLALAGYIKPACHFDLDDAALALVLDDRAGNRIVPFQLDCNVPVSFEVESAHGGMRHAALDRLPATDAFQVELPYNLEFSFDAENASSFAMSSADIAVTPGAGTPGVIPYKSRGRVRLDWMPERPLVAGQYRDVIRIRVIGDGPAGHSW